MKTKKTKTIKISSKKNSKGKESVKKVEEMATMISENEKDASVKTQQILDSIVQNSSHSEHLHVANSSDEAIALHLAEMYFKDVARLGFKRSLEIDDVINAYFYALARVKRKDFESKEIMDAIKRAKSY